MTQGGGRSPEKIIRRRWAGDRRAMAGCGWVGTDAARVVSRYLVGM